MVFETVYNLLVYLVQKCFCLSTPSAHNTNVITTYSQTAVSQIGCCDGSNNYNMHHWYFEHSNLKDRPTILKNVRPTNNVQGT
jgi:hypothetical protein